MIDWPTGWDKRIIHDLKNYEQGSIQMEGDSERLKNFKRLLRATLLCLSEELKHPTVSGLISCLSRVQAAGASVEQCYLEEK